MAHQNEWNRTGVREVDFLHLYINSLLYDCSFKVGSDEAGYKVFKCHKLILATASPFFEKLLYSSGVDTAYSFVESTMGPNEEIPLKNINPIAFDAAMKFVYGSITDFGDVISAIDVFLFANEMMIENLKQAVKEHIKKGASPANIFAIYNMFKLTDNDEGLKWSWEAIQDKIEEAFLSDCWKEVCPETVQDVLKADFLDVGSETVVYKALISWGSHQVQKRTGREPEVLEVREESLEHLKLVRFSSMTRKEFTDLDPPFLTDKEKYGILISLETESSSRWPTGFSVEKRTPPVSGKSADFISITLVYHKWSYFDHDFQTSRLFVFEIDKEAYLVAVQLQLESMRLGDFSFELSDYASYLIYGHGGSRTRYTYGNQEYYKVRKSVLLLPNTRYDLKFVPDNNMEMEISDVKIGKPQLQVKNSQGLLKLRLRGKSRNYTVFSTLVFKLKAG